MKIVAFLITFFVIVFITKVLAQPSSNSTTTEPNIHIEDVYLFYKVYDGANGHPTVTQIQHDYIGKGTDGLRTFLRLRNTTAERIEEAIEKQPQLYIAAKEGMSSLPAATARLQDALNKLRRIYPEAKFPPVTICVGRGKPVGIGSPVNGVGIGLDALCGVTYYDKSIEDRFVHVIAHEYVHVQQPQEMVDDNAPTVLKGSLIEGAADFIGELISGGLGNVALAEMARGHEKEIETAFVVDQDKLDLSKWLYNGSMDKSGDIGYWVGYRICKSYYQNATDKQAAIREIIEMRDPQAFLAKSGWYPGLKL